MELNQKAIQFFCVTFKYFQWVGYENPHSLKCNTPLDI